MGFQLQPPTRKKLPRLKGQQEEKPSSLGATPATPVKSNPQGMSASHITAQITGWDMSSLGETRERDRAERKVKDYGIRILRRHAPPGSDLSNEDLEDVLRVLGANELDATWNQVGRGGLILISMLLKSALAHFATIKARFATGRYDDDDNPLLLTQAIWPLVNVLRVTRLDRLFDAAKRADEPIFVQAIQNLVRNYADLVTNNKKKKIPLPDAVAAASTAFENEIAAIAPVAIKAFWDKDLPTLWAEPVGGWTPARLASQSARLVTQSARLATQTARPAAKSRTNRT